MQTIDVRILGNQQFLLLDDVSVSTSKYNITAFKGFVCDLASIPKMAHEEIGCPTDFALEGLIHDLLSRSRVVSRADADDVFYELLIQQGVDEAKAKLMYEVLRLTGWVAYDNSIDNMADYRNYVSVEPKNII